ncbi:MAG: MTH938/NDUFAF3 family protein [Rudaea sp.]
MQLTEHRNAHQLFIRRADATSVTVIDRALTASVVVSANAVVENFPYTKPDQLDDAAIETIAREKPEVVLLGTGEKIVFPPQRFLAGFLRRGIGIETMDSAAVARTFNVLIGEGRKAVAVFLIG